MAGSVAGSLYGGGDSGKLTGNTKIEVSGTVGKDVFGGGYKGSVGGNTETSITGTVTGSLYGGGNDSGATVSGGTTVTVDGKVSGPEGIFGGGLNANVTGSTALSTPNAYPDFTGQSEITAPTSHGAYVKVTGQVPNGDVHGGGSGTGTVTQNTVVDFQGTKDGNAFDHSIYGGGQGTVGGNSYVSLTVPVATNANDNNNHIFGGGDGAGVTGTSHLYINTIDDVVANVYGGSKNAGSKHTKVVIVEGTVKEVPGKDSGNIYGGNLEGSSTSTTLYFLGGALTNNIYGGNDTSGSVTGTAKTFIRGDLKADNTVYGGSHEAAENNNNIVGTTEVEIDAAVFEHVYGGGLNSRTNNSNITVTKKGIVGDETTSRNRDVYGAGENGSATAAHVTIQGDATDKGTVYGHVYGSGHITDTISTATVGSTKVDISGNIVAPATSDDIPYDNLTGNVHGGSNMPVTGTTTVNILPNAQVQFVFGGGTTAGVADKASVNVSGGTVTREVYGGGAGNGDAETTVGSTAVTLTGGKLQDHIYGGGFAVKDNADNNYVAGDTSVTVKDETGSDALVIADGKNIYGGGNGSKVSGSATITIDTDTKAAAGTTKIFGGSTDNYHRNHETPEKREDITVKSTKITITKTGTTGTNNAPYAVYGGGENTDILENTKITMNSGEIRENIYGGGYNGLVKGTGTATETTKVTVKGGSIVGVDSPNITEGIYYYGSVFGGGQEQENDKSFKSDATVTGNTQVDILDTAIVKEDVFGGGRNAKVTGDTAVTVKATVANGAVYGGGDNRDRNTNTNSNYSPAEVEGNTVVTIDSGKIKNDEDRAEALPTSGASDATTAAGYSRNYGSVYGGGAVSGANVKGRTHVILTGAYNIASDVYGGGFESNITGAADGTTPVTKVDVNGDTGAVVTGNIYGGGDGNHKAFEGHVAGTIDENTVTLVTVSSKAPKANVFGGGWRSAYTNGSTKVVVEADAEVAESVYGAGLDTSTVNGNTNVEISGKAKNVFGGGEYKSPVKATTSPVLAGETVVLINGEVTENVRGGGWQYSPVAADATVTVNTDGTVGQDVYGGGWVNNSYIGGNTYVTIDGAVERDVYGGGAEDSPVNGTIAPRPDTTEGTTVTINGTVARTVYGGGLTNSDVTQDTDVIINGKVGLHTYGGGTETSHVARNSTVTVNTGATVGFDVDFDSPQDGDVYGGGLTDSNIGNDTQVTIHGTVARDVFGGGIENSKVAKNAFVDVTGTVGQNVFGGGTQTQSHIGGYTVVDMLGGSTAQNVFGGGWKDSDVNGINPQDGNGAVVTIHDGSEIFTDVYGAGWDNASILKTDASTKVLLKTAGVVRGSVYGGGKEDSTVANATVVDIYGTVDADSGNRLENNVYGGGYTNSAVNTSLTNGTTVTLYDGALVAGNVFGGGRDNSPVQGVKGTKVTLNTGSVVGDVDVFYPISPSYQSYPTYVPASLSDQYPLRGNVYGGGTAGGSQSDDFATTVASHVEHTNGLGTDVTIHSGAHASGVIYGGGYDSDVITPQNGTAKVLVEGHVAAVHGGGRQGQVDNVEHGTKVHITGATALVNYDVYGGGYAENRLQHTEVKKTDVLIDKGANVRERVFGGGHLNGAEVRETTNVVINDAETLIGHKELHSTPNLISETTGIRGNEVLGSEDSEKPFVFYNRYTDLRGDTQAREGARSFNAFGSVYGGGNNTDVHGDSSILIDNNHRNKGQKVYDRISGGNLGKDMASSTASRYVELKDFGQGDYTKVCTNGDIPYCPLDQYAVVRFLQDYTEALVDDSYLTLYYNLESYDDGNSLLGGQYSGRAPSAYYHNKGIYHPWRPEPHKQVRIEPEVRMRNQSIFRMRGGYTINLENGIFVDDKPTYSTISLRIDLLPDDYVATTSKIYSTSDNVQEYNIFRYTEVPRTIFPKNITYLVNDHVRGINLYIPPRKIAPSEGSNTGQGGSKTPDRGTGSSGGGGFGGGFGGGGATGVVSARPSVTGVAAYIVTDSVVLNQGDAVKRATEALQKSGAQKLGVVTEQKAGQVSGDTLRAMQQEAVKAGGRVRYFADTVRKPSYIEGRMYIEPSKAAGVTGNLNTGVYVHDSKIKAVSNLFAKYFKNQVAIVHMAHEGELGMEVEVAARVDLSKLNSKTLYFYSYSVKTNSYIRIANPNYYVDSNGYLHFNTTVGGDIIITDQPLQHK